MSMKQDKKVIVFPGAVKLLVKKGLKALENEDGKEALKYFEEALQIDGDDAGANFGRALSLMKLEKYEEALEITSEMLDEGKGDFYDILHVHVTLLFHMARYDEALAILEEVMTEEPVPEKYTQSFFAMLQFARNMLQERGTQINVDEELGKLKNGSKDEQWDAMQKLMTVKSDEVIQAFQQFLEEDKNDLILKTLALKLLKEMDVPLSVAVIKFGKQKEVNVKELKDPYENEFAKEVAKRITERLENENPSLKEGALQIWWFYIFSHFPFDIEPEDANLWAAAIEAAALESFGMELDENKIASDYGLPIPLLLETVNKIMTIFLQNDEKV